MGINEVTGRIIGAAIQVHRILGPGLLESAYQACLKYELTEAGLAFESQKALPILYKGTRVDCAYRLDFVIEGQVVLEIKSAHAIDPINEAQMITYLKLSGCPVGLLINFRVPVLKAGIRRFILSESQR